MNEIQLGDKVRCIHTGFTGIVVCKSEFINGCVQWMVLPKGDKNNKLPEEMGIDSQSLIIILRGKKGKEIDAEMMRKKKEAERDYLKENKEPRMRTGGKITRNLHRRNF